MSGLRQGIRVEPAGERARAAGTPRGARGSCAVAAGGIAREVPVPQVRLEASEEDLRAGHPVQGCARLSLHTPCARTGITGSRASGPAFLTIDLTHHDNRRIY